MLSGGSLPGMAGRRITHWQMHALCLPGNHVVWFRPEGGYRHAYIDGLIFRPIPEGASPWDEPDWWLDVAGSVLAQRMIDSEPLSVPVTELVEAASPEELMHVLRAALHEEQVQSA
jgi:hypothetical protein